jgi:hypothetical protein
MNKVEENIRHNLELQIKMTQGYITLWSTKIQSGAYKFDNIMHFDQTPLTDDEKLKHSMDILKSHVDRLYQLVDNSMMSTEQPECRVAAKV